MLKKITKVLKWFLVTVLVLLLLLVSVPVLFKNKIKNLVLTHIDRNIDATVNFTDLSLSSFKKFPRFTITLHNVSVIGVTDFKNDTLVSAKEISVSFNLDNLIKGHNIEVKGIHLERPTIYARILPNGKANYNILKENRSKKDTARTKEFDVNIDEWSINNGRIIYDDKLQNTYIEVGGLYHNGSGDFQQEISNLDITTRVTDLTLVYNGIRYFNKKLFAADLFMEMNLKEKKFIFKDHTFQLGAFKFGFNGYFKLLENGYQTDLNFVVKETSFRNLLSLLPGIYQKDLEGIDTKGYFNCTGFMKGIYNAKANTVPSFHLDLKVDDAMFKYKHLPKAVENINFHLVADNPDGNAEHSSYDIKTFRFELDKEPVHGRIFLKGKKELFINADIKLRANLAEIEKFYPIKDLVLKGILNSEIKINGKYNDSLKLFPKVDAFINLKNGYVKSAATPLDMDSIHIDAEIVNTNGQLADTRISLNNVTFLLDDEPFLMKGTIFDMTNYNYDLKIDGLVDLDKLTKLYPVVSSTLSGTLNFDINAKGSLTEIEARQFALLQTQGTLEVKNVSYKTDELAFPIHVDDALFTFSPDKIILNSFKAEFGKSNVNLSGHLYNYIPYLLRKDAPIKGDLTMHCDTIDLNEWFPSSVASGTTSNKNSTSQKETPEVILIPKQVDFTIDSDVQLVKFGKMDISRLKGEIQIKKGVLTLKETGFNTMDSPFILSGDYDTKDPEHPLFDLNFEVDKLDINTAYQMFVDEKAAAPAQGNFSINYALKGEVTPDFSPIYSTLAGNGKITIENVSIKGMKLFNHIKTFSKKDEFNNPELSDIVMDTEIKGGKILIYPFSFKVNKFLTELEGWQSFDNTMNYEVKLSVPPFKKLRIPVNISGNPDKPVIKIGKGFDNSDFEKL